MNRRILELLIFTVSAGLLTGCAEPALPRVELTQPQLLGPQKQLSLQTDQARWADQGVLRLLAEFPLPGAATGRPAYIVYLRLHPGAATQPADIGRKSGGFFIQTRGADAGLAEITAGTVSAISGQGGRLAVRLDLTCEDGTRLKGELTARRDEFAVQDFERHQRAADVEKLRRRMGE